MELVTKDAKVLRQKSKTVSKVDKKIVDLVESLFEKLETLEGVGLAAPQIGTPYQVAVIEYTHKNDEEEPQDIPKTALINPRIVWCTKDKETKTEACFSLPKTEVAVPRFKKIHVEYVDESGKKKKIKAKGLLARAIQHEIDHLNGILITDYK